jgi:phasin family protein
MSGKKATIDGLAVVQDVVRESVRQVSHGFESVASGARQAEATAAAASNETKAHTKSGMEQAMKHAEQILAFSQGNVEAMMKSSQIWVSGLQDLSRQITATAQASFQDNVSVLRSLTAIRTLQDAVALQTSAARTAMEKAMTESTRLTETSMKLAEQASAPLTARVGAAMEMVSTPRS